jgi:serine/threonine-protein kinase
VGFFAAGKLKKINLDGGAPVILCDAPAGRGASWGEDGRIVAALDTRHGLSLVTADGGLVSRATELGPGEINHPLPQMLQGGKAVLFTVANAPAAYATASVAVASLETVPANARVILPKAGMFPRYLPSGHLVYVSRGSLHAVPFDENRLEVRGGATPVLEDVASSAPLGVAQLAFSKSGHFLYRRGRTSGLTTFQWLTADGRYEPLWEESGFYSFSNVSPDGNRLLTVKTEGTDADVWIYDPQRGGRTRLTAGTGVNTYPIWSPDGQWVVFGWAAELSQCRWLRAPSAVDQDLGVGISRVLRARRTAAHVRRIERRWRNPPPDRADCRRARRSEGRSTRTVP